ncbi:MAG: iron transporter [Candidatus Neomarinimicrobiota bacterium]
MIFFLSLLFSLFQSPELIIGQEKVPPGIVFIFEGAVKDKIYPASLHLPENQTHVHLEARVNWDDKQIPKGATPGGFIPFLHITATVTNSKSGQQLFVDLKPHINLIDNFHYARNIALPGSIKDNYNVKFNILSPSNIELALHNDWTEKYGKNLLNDYTFNYKRVNFKQIAEAIRN